MTPNEQILRSFLVSVGFRIDDNAFRRFQEGMNRVDSKAMLVAKSVAAVAVAAEAMVHIFSMSMEKLYYASQRTKASVKNIQALEYGAQQIGVSADTARGQLEAMASALRMNPGLRGLLDQFLGRSTAGEDQATVMLDLVQKLSTMPHMVGAQFAQMFGMDEQTFLMYKQKMPELLAAMERRRNLAKQSGIDEERAAANAREYMNLWRTILERVEVVSQKLANDLLPHMRKLVEYLDDIVTKAADFSFDPETLKYVYEMRDALFGIVDSLIQIAEKVGMIDFAKMFAGSVKQDMLAFAHLLNAILQLIRGDIEAAKESFASAIYRFQGSPTPMHPDIKQSVSGKIGGGGTGTPSSSSPGWGEDYTKGQYQKELDETRRRMAAGVPSMAEYQKLVEREAVILHQMKNLGGVPTSTGYAPVASAGAAAAQPGNKKVEVNMKTDIHVNGSGDPGAVARNVAGAQRNVGADIVRNMEGVVR